MNLHRKTSLGFLLRDTDRKQKRDDDEIMDDPSSSSSSNETAPKNDDVRSSSNASDSNGKSESSRTGTNNEDEANLVTEELAHQETNNVFRLRIAVITVQVAVASIVSYLIFDITRKAEIAAFETEFEGNAELIIISLNGKYKDKRVVMIICV